MEKKEYKITYGYDELNRLTRVALNGKVQSYYSYDPAGNLIAISPTAPEKGEEPAFRKEPATVKTAAEDHDIAAPGEGAGAAVVDDRVAALMTEYDRLNDLAQAGVLSLDEFQEKVNGLRFQDAGGFWWQLRFDGVWLQWDGAAWVEQEPGV